jgi:hypothetical protein
VYNLTDNSQFNKTVNPGWWVNLLWTNKTTTGTRDYSLYSLVIFNKTSYNLQPGQSIPIAQSPSPYKLTFSGDSAPSVDAMNFTTGETSNLKYTNKGTTPPAGLNLWDLANITEPGQTFTVTSKIPGAFTYGSQTSASVMYDLTPYAFNEYGNVITASKTSSGTHGGAQATSVGANYIGQGTEIAISYQNAGSDANAWINANVVLSMKGYTVSSTGVVSSTNTTASNTLVTTAAGVSGNYWANAVYDFPTTFFNITSLSINKALPSGGSLTIALGNPGNTIAGSEYSAIGTPIANALLLGTYDTANTMASLTSIGSGNGAPLLYFQNGATNNYTMDTSSNVVYQQGSGEQGTNFAITKKTVTGQGQGTYYTYTMNEIAVPGTVQFDQLQLGMDNSSAGLSDSNLYMLNYSAAGNRGNMSYVSTINQGGTGISAPEGFRTERGSKVATVDGGSPRTDVIDVATTEDLLRFALGAGTSNAVTSYTICPSASSAGILKGGSLASCGIANTTVYNIAGNVTLGSNAKYTIGGLGNLTSAISTTPASVDSVTLLKNLSTTTPLVVLDSAANPASNLILIGSGYVNTLSQQLQTSQGINITGPSSPSVMQAFGGTGTSGGKILLAGYSAQNTTTEVNAFIQWLYAHASA